MKRILTALLALVMVLGLTACVASDPTTGKTNPATKPSTPTSAPTTAPTTPTEPTKPEEPEAIFTLDNEHFSFTVLSANSAEEGYALEVAIVNKSSALQSFSVTGVTANDYVCPDIFMNSDVNAGETKNEVIVIAQNILEGNGITTPTKVEFALSAMNGETWDELYNAPCTVYPKGEENHVDDGGYTAQEGDTVLVDNEHCTVIVTGSNSSNETGYVLNLYVANKCNTTLYFEATNVTVNNLMFDPWWSVEVPAGKRCVSQMIWNSDALTTYGIGDITKIDFDLSAKDPMDWESPEFAGEHCTLYPMGEEAYKPFERPAQETDIVLMDNEYVTIIIISKGMDADGGYTMNLFIQNKADVNICVKPTNVCINGVEVDPWWFPTITAGKATFSSISWGAFALNENNITAVEAITMTMNIFDELGENTFASEEITVNP